MQGKCKSQKQSDQLGADGNVEHLLTTYYRMCAEAGVGPLPDDEAREQATALMAVLVPAFEVTFRQH